jgi:hypothetical protein
LIPVTEQSAIDGHPANFTYRGLPTYLNNFGNPNNWRASASYVTGAHNVKAGYQGSYLIADSEFDSNVSQLSYRFLNHVPNQFTYRLPAFQTADRTKVTALFDPDTWTRERLTVQGALRFDQASSFSPSEHNGTALTSRFNAVLITLVETPGVSSTDLSPRFGIAHDLFGNGKTAVKFNYGRYLGPATNDTIYTQNNPANGIVGYNAANVSPRRSRAAGLIPTATTLSIATSSTRRSKSSPVAIPAARSRGMRSTSADRDLDASEPCPVEWLEHPPVRLAMGHQPPAGVAAPPVAGGRLQPSFVESLHRHGQSGGGTAGLSGVGDQRAEGLEAPGRRRLPDHELHADRSGGGSAR